MTAGGKTQAEWAAMGERMAERYKEIAKTTRDILNSSKEGTLGYIAGMRKANDYLGRAGRSAIASWEKQIKKIEAVEAALARGARVSESMLAGLDLIDKQRLDNVRSAIERTNDEAGKLDKKRLGGFRNEIRRTREDVDQLRNSLKDTASDLERELASIRGETVRAEELEQQRKMAELQAKYKEAKQAGDREAIAAAQRALSLQRQINEERMKQVKAEAAPPQQDSATPAPSQNVPGATSKSTPQGTSTQVVRLQLDLGTGEPVEGQYSEADADRLLRQLREKGAVTR
jgi:hypothetical protein